MAFIATVLAMATSVLLLPLFNSLAGKHLTLSLPVIAWLFLLLLVLSILVGLLAGAFKPVAVLSGNLSGFKSGSRLRNFPVVFQFAISLFLIIRTMVIYGQVNYIQNKDLGFDRDQVLIVKNLNAIESEAQTLKQQIRQLPGFENVTMSSFLPTGERRWLNYLATPSGATLFGYTGDPLK